MTQSFYRILSFFTSFILRVRIRIEERKCRQFRALLYIQTANSVGNCYSCCTIYSWIDVVEHTYNTFLCMCYCRFLADAKDKKVKRIFDFCREQLNTFSIVAAFKYIRHFKKNFAFGKHQTKKKIYLILIFNF